MAEIEIVGFGAMNIDRLYQVDEIVVDGEQLVKDFVSSLAGQQLTQFTAWLNSALRQDSSVL